jgi:hypothetical protein
MGVSKALARLRAPIGAVAAALVALAVPSAAGASPVIHVDGDSVEVVEDPLLPPRSATDLREPPATAVPRRLRALAAAGPSVSAALRSARDRGQISQAEHDAFRALYAEARATARRLSGSRRRQLSSVLATLRRIAARRQLTASRMPALFLQLHRNEQYWPTGPMPRNGARITFAGSPVIFQHYSGMGLQIQELANFGKVNAAYRACVHERPSCDREELREFLDWMVAIASRRGGFAAWEYFFPFGGGSPPWISSISQGTAIQALSRGTHMLDDPAYAAAARAGLGAFERRSPTGLRKRGVRGGSHYLGYSFAPRLEILNMFLQSLIGLFDYTKITDDPRGRSLFAAGDRAARREVPLYDTGNWSLYSRRGARASLSYHTLQTGFLKNLCDRTGTSVYCRYAARWEGFLRARGLEPAPDDPPASRPRPRPSLDDDWRITVSASGNRRELVFERTGG